MEAVYHYEINVNSLYLSNITLYWDKQNYEGRTESQEQLFFSYELGTAEEGECGGRWNQLLCYP